MKGFSIIELMIVLFMIAFIGTGVSISVGAFITPEKRLLEVGQRLFEQMEFARDEALMQQTLLGLRIEIPESDDGGPITYSWHSYQSKRWVPITNSLPSTTIDEEFVLVANIEDELLDALLEERLNSVEENEELPPAIIFYPNSEISEFSIELYLKEERQDKPESFVISINERGELQHSAMEEVQEQ